ncbi:AMP-binding protein, partial [Staphylococcus xylosus]|uniref:AMP-binding protein n=1 Tax=Staphylococcus xylosus TaxID=1288 RepID=UPI003F57404E
NQSDIIPIGKPITNTDIYILNTDGNQQPIGQVGEIYIGGSGVARGYINNSELTNEKFISSPFSENQILYKTGDLGKWLPDGNIDYIGRTDNQVKVRGYRIELEEIE